MRFHRVKVALSASHHDAVILRALGRTAVRKKLTITLEEKVHDGLCRVVGRATSADF
jgi:hypothetical protein